MRDVIFKTFAEIDTPVEGVVGLGGFAVDEYISSIIIDPDDSYASIDAMIDTALHAGSDILMFDINYAMGKQISHIRNMMKKKSYKEMTNLYETRIAFAKEI